MQKCRAFPLVADCCCKSDWSFRYQRNVPAEMQDDSAGCGMLLHFCRAFPLAADVPAKVQETFKCDLFVAPVWRNNPLTAETPSSLEEGFHRDGFHPPVWREVSDCFCVIMLMVARVGNATDALHIICRKA